MHRRTPGPAGVSRRGLVRAGGAGAVLAAAHAVGAPSAWGSPPGVRSWLNRSARPLAGTDPGLPATDLRPLDRIVRGAAVVGLGESAHGTDDQFRLKNRIIRYLVERHGVRTIAWEDAWGAGVAIDRYVTHGVGDPRRIVVDAGFNLHNAALLELMSWLRARNATRPPADRVRFLGADVVQLRKVQFTELAAYVRWVAPGLADTLAAHLHELRIRQDPGPHIYWYVTQSAATQRRLIDHARAVRTLIDRLPHRHDAPVSRLDAELHALSLVGFYESYTAAGGAADLRDVYITRILDRWRRDRPARLVYSAANAHTVAAAGQLVSLPPDPVTERSLAGGRLRAGLGRDYVSLGLTFDHGQITAAWDTGQPRVFTVPPPHHSFVDHDLRLCRYADYLVDLRAPAPDPVRRWLRRPGTLRVIGGASYDPARDRMHYMTVPRWGTGFDALLHLGTVSASRLP